MSDAVTSANQHLRDALTLYRQEEIERVNAFNREMTELRDRIAGIEKMIGPLRTTSYGERAPARSPEATVALARVNSHDEFVVPQELISQLTGLSQPEALVRIAQGNNGILRTVEAKQILLKAGLITGNPKNAISHMFQLLKDADRFGKIGFEFEKIGPGAFQLHAHRGGRMSDEGYSDVLTRAVDSPEDGPGEEL